MQQFELKARHCECLQGLLEGCDYRVGFPICTTILAGRTPWYASQIPLLVVHSLRFSRSFARGRLEFKALGLGVSI